MPDANGLGINCFRCGVEFKANSRHLRELKKDPNKRHFCSHKCYKGGQKRTGEQYIDKDGYIVVVFPSGAFHLHKSVAQQKLGRYLLPGEIVHHVDGNKLNNESDNIEITTRSEHGKIHHANQGEKHPSAKISNVDAAIIRERYKSGESRKKIAQDFGITNVQVWNIGTGRQRAINTSIEVNDAR